MMEKLHSRSAFNRRDFLRRGALLAPVGARVERVRIANRLSETKLLVHLYHYGLAPRRLLAAAGRALKRPEGGID